MLAVFGKQRPATASSPLSPGSKRRATDLSPEDETFVASVLDQLYSSLPRRQRVMVQEMGFGGPSGIGYVESMRHQLSHDNEIYVFFKGELQNNPSDLEDAEYILQEYKNTYEHASLLEPTPVMEMLGKLEGPFAFILYDKSYGRIVAARDPQGLEPLVWGTTMLSEGLLFASERALIEGECADADDFPAGTLFTSNDFSTSGTLTPIRPEGLEVGQELCRVESKADDAQGSSSLQKVASQSQIEAN